ncbi:MAG: hypothetical protein IKM20_02960 [Erysipelotrichales bacterium]|nr:hypothetical protein [Erysipelotrichales bacterium]
MLSVLRKMKLQIAGLFLFFLILAILCMEIPVAPFVILITGISLTIFLTITLGIEIFALKRRLQRYDVDLSLDMDNVVYKNGNIIITEDFIINHSFIFFTACFREEVDHAHYPTENTVVIVKENGSKMTINVTDDDTRKEINYFLGAVLHGVKNDCVDMWLEIPDYYKKQTTTVNTTTRPSVNTNRVASVKSIASKKQATSQNYAVLVVIGVFVVTFTMLLFVTVLSVFDDGYATPEPSIRVESSLDYLYEKYINIYPYRDGSDKCEAIISETELPSTLIVSNACDAISEVDIDFFKEYEGKEEYLGTYYVSSMLPYTSRFVTFDSEETPTRYAYASYSAMFKDVPDLPRFMNMMVGVSYSDDIIFIAVEDLNEEKALQLADYYKNYVILAYQEYCTIYLMDAASVDENFVYTDGGYYEPDYIIDIYTEEGIMYVSNANGGVHHSIWLD